MFVEGALVDHSDAGWTDAAFSYPFPALLFHPPGLLGVDAAMTEEHAWEGSRSVEINLAAGQREKVVPFFPLAVPPLRPGVELEAWVVWMATDWPGASVTPLLSNESASLERLSVETASTSSSGWRRTSTRMHSNVETWSNSILTFHIELRNAEGLRVGAVGVQPLAPASTRPAIANLQYAAADSALRWDIDFIVSTAARVSTDAFDNYFPPFQHFHVFLRDEAGNRRYLGTTVGTEYRIAPPRIEGAQAVIVQGTDGGGRLEEVDSCQL
jgi:hypothetical protein